MTTTHLTGAQAEARDIMLTLAERKRYLIGSTAEIQFSLMRDYEEQRHLYRLAGFGELPPVTGIGARALEEVA